MRQQKPVNKKSDTTKIPTPYKVLPRELIGSINNAKGGKVVDIRKGLPLADSSVKKMKYNRESVIPATIKRNSERAKEGKKPISKTGNNNQGYSHTAIGLSEKGKTFKEAPLKTKNKKK